MYAKGMCISCYMYLKSNRKSNIEKSKRWRAKNPDKYKAIQTISMLRNCLRNGILTKEQVIKEMDEKRDETEA